MNNILHFLKSKSPQILIGASVVGLVTSVIFAIKATPKAIDIIQKDEKKKGAKLTPVEKIQKTAYVYIPTVSMVSMTIATMIASHYIHSKRHSAVLALYSTTSHFLKEYQNKVVEQIGKKNEKIIKDSVDTDRVNMKTSEQRVFDVGAGNTVLCYDKWSGRYFKSTIPKVHSYINEINSKVLKEDRATLNDLYYLFGLPEIPDGELMGWATYPPGVMQIEPRYSAQLTPEDEPCYVVEITPSYLEYI